MSDADPLLGTFLHRHIVLPVRGEAETRVRDLVRKMDQDQRERLKQQLRQREPECVCDPARGRTCVLHIPGGLRPFKEKVHRRPGARFR